MPLLHTLFRWRSSRVSTVAALQQLVGLVMWKKVLGGTLAVAMGVWMLALIVPQPAPPAWGDVWWWRNQLILLTGVAAWALMSLIMVLAVRPAWLEKPLDGLDTVSYTHLQ